MKECFAYDDVLKKNGHFVAERRSRAPQRHDAAVAQRQGGRHGRPFAETKEQLGGILVLEATDLNHAIQLMSKHPACDSAAASSCGLSMRRSRRAPIAGLVIQDQCLAIDQEFGWKV
jgi:hypothetical protein